MELACRARLFFVRQEQTRWASKRAEFGFCQVLLEHVQEQPFFMISVALFFQTIGGLANETVPADTTDLQGHIFARRHARVHPPFRKLLLILCLLVVCFFVADVASSSSPALACAPPAVLRGRGWVFGGSIGRTLLSSAFFYSVGLLFCQ